ncbi:hypothetical protein GGR28_003410 [Lewinella aquimaris]|uniref:Carboxypeptidase-like regulatory domain-containing protein n=1 Tax=Neolewinella aquimaris TaxID=1835722 RepID=A0A840EB58_9BACT|nr:carboxypeptidase-like regulatory domain-containing protein [Neolewinella aquimaris]MBB4080775.1 hypothetical protein [Neolewinella aquimaris]
MIRFKFAGCIIFLGAQVLLATIQSCSYEYIYKESIVLGNLKTYRGYIRIEKTKASRNKTLKIIGRVISDDNYGLPQAKVIVGNDTAFVTDFDGRFDIELKSLEGEEKLGVECLGYRSIEVPIYQVHGRRIEIKLAPVYVLH